MYSVGCTLFELLAGRPPYDMRDSRNVAALFRRIIDDPPPLVSELRPDVLPEVSRIVSRALHRDRSVRYADCTSMRAALIETMTNHRGSGVPGQLTGLLDIPELAEANRARTRDAG